MRICFVCDPHSTGVTFRPWGRVPGCQMLSFLDNDQKLKLEAPAFILLDLFFLWELCDFYLYFYIQSCSLYTFAVVQSIARH